MGSATRHAMTAAVGAIQGLGTGLGIDVATQIFAIEGILAANRQLRAVFADDSVPTEAKEGLFTSLFGDAVGDAARGVLFTALAQRWSTDDDLTAGIEELGIRAAAEAGDADRVQRELFSFGRAVASDPGLELALDSKADLDDEKIVLIDALIGDRALEATKAILHQVVCSRQSRSTRSGLERAARIVADQRGQVVATVTVARELSATRQKAVGSELAERYGTAVNVNYVIDPGIVGGMRIRVGDEVIDGTITSRLADARLRLAS